MGRFLLAGLGSSGDVNPLLGLAAGLRARGHETVLLSAPQFSRAALEVGADFEALGTAEAYESVYANPDLWHPRRGLAVFFPYAAGLAARTAELIERRNRQGQTVIVATFQCFGARVAREALRIPLCTILPNPILLQSVHDPNHNPIGNPPSWLGKPAVRLMYRLINREVSRHARSGVNEARQAWGLETAVRDVVAWSRSPDLVLGLWPALLSAPQSDWPPQARVSGFVTHDGPAASSWRPPTDFPDIGNWLVFTPGTQMTHGAPFFRAAAEAAARLGSPAVMVCKDASVLPDPLPSNVRHLPYAPFAWLFERATAVVHHGGIGTAGRALQAGVPQLIVPSGFDQFDNADRICRLGAGLQLRRSRLTARTLEQSLRQLLESSTIRQRCTDVQDQLAQTDATETSCLRIEALLPDRRADDEPTL